MKRITKVLCLLLLVTLAVPLPVLANSRAYRNASLEADILNEIETVYNEKYIPSDVDNAVNAKQDTLISKVKKPASMGITTPNIDMDKIIAAYPLTEYGDEENNVFIQDLKKHGYSMNDIYNFNYEDYKIISSKWLMDEEHIRAAKNLYPELKDVDLTTWTNGDFEAYFRKVDFENYQKRFTERQMQELNERNISLEDAYVLIKEYQHIDNALSQPDAVLKSMIEQHYQFKLDQLSILAELQNNMIGKSSDPPPSVREYYKRQVMPRWNDGLEDWFQKSVVTSLKWTTLQSDRTLNMINAIYDLNWTDFDGKYNGDVTNMYGTWSDSRQAAHEGIDFAIGSLNTDLRAIFTGKVTGTRSRDGMLAVYDSDVDKTYIYLHNESFLVNDDDDVGVGDIVSKQGSKGIGTGVHLHFEVRSGNTPSPAPVKDHEHTLEAISPYQMQIYIGGE